MVVQLGVTRGVRRLVERTEMSGDIFDKFPTVPPVVRGFDNLDYCGLVVKWMEKGTGFGEITIVCDKSTSEWRVDTEHMGPDFCGKVFARIDGASSGTQDAASSTDAK